MKNNRNAAAAGGLPARPVDRLLRPLVRFLQIESASGLLLLACTALALALTNSPWSEGFLSLWQTPVNLKIGDFAVFKDKALLLLINDGLMAIFFFVIGLEIKRELVMGELREPRKAALPVLAALGGMVVPAAVYFALQQGQPGERGWGIPMATDIAFVVGFLALFGSRVPPGLKIFLLSLAIADDLGAVLVIALFYTEALNYGALGLAAAGFVLVVLFNLLGVRRVGPYVVLGALIWLAFLKSGVHPTIAGVLLGLLTPARAWVGDQTLLDVLDDAARRLRGKLDRADRHDTAENLEWTAREAVSPLARLEHALHPWVAFAIMPLFALANAGVALRPQAASDAVALAVAAGLFFGKPIGIVLFSGLAVFLRVARLPSGVTWPALAGAGLLGGIGFTMSLFVAGLALEGDALEAGKVGTLMGSAVSALCGCALLALVLPRKRLVEDPGNG